MATYVIVDNADVVQQMIDDCLEDSTSTLRHSIAGVDRVVLKYNGAQPASLSGYTEYDHAAILTEMAGTDWTEAV